ncbi:MAG TPA: disulfide bond formation protein B [Gaiellaceae bacterium]|nr:disulfide bond formation protein B [Gaiellaceae bacterium]
MARDVLYAYSYLGVAGQVLIALMLLLAMLALLGIRSPLDLLRRMLWGYELWAAFVVAALATGGSLFYSEVMGFIPCEFCWYQRICMYPLSILLLIAAWYGENRLARYLVVLPIGGACVSIYHMFIAYGAIHEPTACTVTPGGCAINWLAIPAHDVTFGYLTIPTLALTAFLLLIGFLVLAATGTADDVATLPADA